MRVKNKVLLSLSLFIQLVFSEVLFAQQQEDRFMVLEKKITEVSKGTPGLTENVDFSVTGASIQEFLGGLAASHELNFSIDPSLQIRVYNKFTNEKVFNVILFLVKEYDLDITFQGTIMSFKKYIPPMVKNVVPLREINVKYSAYNNLLSLDLRNDTLDRVAKKLTQMTRKNVIFSSGLANTLVSVYIEDMPFEDALNKMAYANKLKVIKTDDNFYVLKSIEEGEDLLTQNKSKRKSTSFAKSISGKGELMIEIEEDSASKEKFISLNAVDIPIMQVIKEVAEVLGVSYFLFSDLKGNTTTSVNHVKFDGFLTYLLQGTEYTYKYDKTLYLLGERKLEGLRAYRVIQLKFRSLDAVQEIIPAELKKGVEVKEFKELNSLLVSGSLPQINEIEAFVQAIDKVVPMVMIEVLLMDIRKNRTIKTGIKAGLSDSTVTTSGTFLPGLDLTLSSGSVNEFLSFLGTNNVFNIGKVTPSFYMTLSALETNGDADVRSTPKLSTLNGHDASLTIGNTIYYSVRTQNISNGITPINTVTEQYNSVEANLGINIKPVVSGDDQVTLTIDVSFTDFIGKAPANGPPPSSTSQFKSIIRVRNEEMVVLGGLERIEKADNSSGTPILSRIPVVKWLFSSREKTRNKLVSVVFIKPTIIY